MQRCLFLRRGRCCNMDCPSLHCLALCGELERDYLFGCIKRQRLGLRKTSLRATLLLTRPCHINSMQVHDIAFCFESVWMHRVKALYSLACHEDKCIAHTSLQCNVDAETSMQGASGQPQESLASQQDCAAFESQDQVDLVSSYILASCGLCCVCSRPLQAFQRF